MEALSLSHEDAAPALARGRYRLIEVIGQGGMATVYRGYDERLSRNVAVKVMKPDLAINQNLRARFVLEAKTMARLDLHRHVVQIYDSGQDDDDHRLYIAMELVGRSLQQVLDQQGRLPPRIAADVMLQVLDALEIAHRHKIVHRDVKPSNILLTRDGTTKVSDFGIARMVDRPGVTQSGAGVGTWAYMAPEQKRNAGKVDHRADVYAVGATLFSLLTHEEPNDLDRVELWQNHLEQVPEPLRDVITRATRYSADERYETASQLRAALTEAREKLPPDPPGSEALLASGLITSPEPAARVTLVPPGGPVAPPSPPPSSYRTGTGGSWSEIVNPTTHSPLARWGTLFALAGLVTGLVYWLTRPPLITPAPPEPEVKATKTTPAPSGPSGGPSEQKGVPEPGPTESTSTTGGGTSTVTTAPPAPTGGAGGTFKGERGASAGTKAATTPPPPPEATPPAPPVYGSARFSVTRNTACKLAAGGAPLLSEGKDVEAGAASLGFRSAPVKIPVGTYHFTCRDDSSLAADATIVEGGVTSVALTGGAP